MAIDVRESFESSELSSSSAEVFAAAADHPITIRQRDGEPLVLMSQREDHARNELLKLAAKLIGVTIGDDSQLVRDMSQQFPWMLALSPDDQIECARDVLNAARASFSTRQAHLALSVLTSWQETAAAIAAGLADHQVEWFEDHEASVHTRHPNETT